MKIRPKVLVDFDGVWTDMAGQAQAVDRHREASLVELSGLALGEVRDALHAVNEHVSACPLQHGWRISGRLAAYADEDPFLRHNALVSGIGLIADSGHPNCKLLRERLARAGEPDLSALASKIFMKACHQFIAEHGHKMREDSVVSLERLLTVADVVFCSNFTTDAIAGAWRKYGFEGLNLRGLAQKQILTADPLREIDIAGRPVAIDRGHYRQIILEEKPDVVVGDVLSMDLALPLSLGGIRCLLMETPFTPQWSRGVCDSGKWPGLQLISKPEKIAEFAEELC